MAIIITYDGEETLFLPKDKVNGFTLEEIKKVLGGGYIEIIRPKAIRKPHTLMVVDDDGHRKNLPVNLKATMMYDPNWINTGRVILGTALLADDKEVQ